MNPNDYERQKERASVRKSELVKLLGGKCSICGYNKNYAALEFHHVNPGDKNFQLDSRHLSNTSKELLLEEVKKCILVCSNCHKEVHHPDLEKQVVDEKLEMLDHGIRSVYKKKKMSKCPVCGNEFEQSKGKIYCSNECRIKDKGYPSKELVLEKYGELKSQQKVAEFFGLTRKIIIDILKR